MDEEAPQGLEVELSELAGMLLANETLDTTLERVAKVAVRAVPACDAAGVSMAEKGQVVTAAISEDLVATVDRHQYDTHEGPCLESLRTGEPRRSERLSDDRRWPAFAPRAVAEGVVSCLSIPLVVGNHGTAGALNMYSRSEAFQQSDEDAGLEFGIPASAAVANARAYAKSRELVDQLQEALQSRDVIGQAKGVLRARTGCSAEEAFATLREMSQRRNVKLRDIAQEVVETADGGPRAE
jgi:GAF domain-containing protein